MSRIITWSANGIQGVTSTRRSRPADAVVLTDTSSTVTLPEQTEVESAIQRGDLVALLDLDHRVRDSLPASFSESVAREATALLAQIASALKGFSTAALSDRREPSRIPPPAEDTTLPRRVEEAKSALSGTGTIDTSDSLKAEREHRPVDVRLADARRALNGGR